MARKPSQRVVMNRAALDAIRLGAADGLQAIGQRIVDNADVPDAPPYGKGLIKTGKAATFVDGRKVAGDGSAPRGEGGKVGTTVTIFGFGFPGRFQELGTVKMQANPFVTPSAQREVPDAGDTIADQVKLRLIGVPDATRS